MVLNIFSLTIEISIKRAPRDFGARSEELEDLRSKHVDQLLKEVYIRRF